MNVLIPHILIPYSWKTFFLIFSKQARWKFRVLQKNSLHAHVMMTIWPEKNVADDGWRDVADNDFIGWAGNRPSKIYVGRTGEHCTVYFSLTETAQMIPLLCHLSQKVRWIFSRWDVINPCHQMILSPWWGLLTCRSFMTRSQLEALWLLFVIHCACRWRSHSGWKMSLFNFLALTTWNLHLNKILYSSLITQDSFCRKCDGFR